MGHIYSVSSTWHLISNASLINHGANGSTAVDDVHVIKQTIHTVDIQGIDNHQIMGIPIVTAGGVITTKSQHGSIIVIASSFTSKLTLVAVTAPCIQLPNWSTNKMMSMTTLSRCKVVSNISKPLMAMYTQLIYH